VIHVAVTPAKHFPNNMSKRPDVITLGTNIELLGSDEEVRKRVEIARTQDTWKGTSIPSEF
jgi:hypothetical protein